MMKTVLIQIIIIFIFASCNQGGETSKYNAEEKANSNLKIETTLQEYLDALINGKKETISKYFYKDAVRHLSKYADYEFKIDEFIEENIIQPALKAKKLYEEKGVRHYYEIEDEINNMEMNNYLISSFLVTDNLVLGEKSIKDTTRFLSFQKGSDVEFIAISEGIENILLYRFNEDEVQKILNTAFEGNYSDFLKKINDETFKEYEWRLEALGQNKDNLFTYNNKLKAKMLSVSKGEIFEKIEFSNLKNNLELISLEGDIKIANYFLSSETIELSIDGMTNKLKYTIKESGIGVYYLNLYLHENNQELVLAYKGYEKTN